DLEQGSREIAMAISGEKEFDTEFRVIWPDGQIRYIRAIAVTQRAKDGEAIKMIGTNWDITELKRAQLELIRSEESFTGAFDNSASGMAIVDLNGKWIRVNSSLCASLGYKEKELLKLTVEDITHPDDYKTDLNLLNKVINGNLATYHIEKRYFHKKGHIVHAILTVTAVFDIGGNLSHFISQIIDISTRIEAEKRLTTLIDVTKEQNNNLLNFAHIVSHNLRSHSTNLAMLTGFLLTEKDLEERKNLERMLKNAADGLDETVQHLNEVVQVKTGALDKLSSISLLNTVKNVRNNISALIKQKAAECEIKIPKSHFVNAVPAYLDSILLNLFTNSIKYSAADRTPVLKITSAKKDGQIILKFKDNGQGIDLDRHGDKIFGMYKTFHKHKDAKGIGLFITKNQIEAMNGKIEVQSEVGSGSTFTLYFNEG
ncbi:MAG: PAS domain S-box protein, partial [Eudoraea sp.]|nr:PAS domain S-box protein [Eudoraea sp.]